MKLNTIICGDSLTVLRQMPSESVDLIITSPPYYGLRKYGDYEEQIGLEETFDDFLKKILEITAELKRVLKPTGQFWLNMGDCYGTGSGAGSRKGTKQATNTGSNYYEDKGKQPPGEAKCLMMMPERIALKMIDEQGWILRNKVKWAKQVLLKKEGITKGSVMPTSVKDRFNESGEELYFFVKNKKYYSDLDAVRMKPQTFENRPDGIIREREFGYDTQYPEARNPKGYKPFNRRVRDAQKGIGPQFRASEEEIKNYGKRKIGNQQPKGRSAFMGGSDLSDYYKDKEVRGNEAGKNLPTVWLIGSEPHNFQKELGSDTDHFAIFPQALVEIPIKFGCPPKGLVCDPFLGSGTVALVARQLGRNFIGIELNKDYIKLAEKRLASIHPSLFF